MERLIIGSTKGFVDVLKCDGGHHIFPKVKRCRNIYTIKNRKITQLYYPIICTSQ